MQLRAVLDDGKAQAGAAHLPGVAFVHAVEALENPALLRLRDADAGIGHGEAHGIIRLFHLDGDAAAGAVVFDGVVAEVIDHFVQ